MLNDVSSFNYIFIRMGYTNLRRGIDGLAATIKNEFHMDPYEQGNIFLFCGRRTDRMKALVYEGDGFVLAYKRLANGRFQWPRNEEEVKAISPQQYRWLMDGLAIEQKRTIKRVTTSLI
ncbi:IS66 family insertion sequence element accessory protein TnpB [Anaerocolumna jejuensis]|uniref:IS66 family insertion sequence element accessory protein TnpB n=1 Tax=Anaerocolumna jejuensis TaxID=259063 RepID=UPI003F7B9789